MGSTCTQRVHDVPSMDMSPERRPRINAELAARLNEIRPSEETFEGYINYVLAEYVDRMEMRAGRQTDENDESTPETRLYDFEDVGGAFCYIDRLHGGWGKDKERPLYRDVVAGLVIDASEQGFDALGVYITAENLRPLRDVCTELLGEIPHPAHGAKAENQ